MQIASPSTLRRCLGAAACLVLLAGCTSAPQDPVPPTAAASDGVEQAREVLGQPMVALAQAVIALRDELDEARFEVPRGDGMGEALDGLTDALRNVRRAAGAAEAAARDAAVAEAAGIVESAARTGRRAADAAEREVTYLGRLQRVDAALLDVAAEWDRPGSQSEIRARLAAAAEQAARTRAAARRARPAPRGCTTMKANRLQWAATVRTRTAQLQAQANSAGGSEYDELRSAYRRLPLGVEPRSADQEERPCWEAESPVARAAVAVREDVEALEAALQ